jgi:hypothetical protein
MASQLHDLSYARRRWRTLFSLSPNDPYERGALESTVSSGQHLVEQATHHHLFANWDRTALP